MLVAFAEFDVVPQTEVRNKELLKFEVFGFDSLKLLPVEFFESAVLRTPESTSLRRRDTFHRSTFSGADWIHFRESYSM